MLHTCSLLILFPHNLSDWTVHSTFLGYSTASSMLSLSYLVHCISPSSTSSQSPSLSLSIVTLILVSVFSCPSLSSDSSISVFGLDTFVVIVNVISVV